ncbi:hypothetical protein C7405_12330 [Paraburkholderia caballeronis]|nr:hypothetical protein C7405_12330 [Paraburkholderia caballeronis]
MQAASERNYLSGIRDDIMRDCLGVAHDLQLSARLDTAYAEARKIGFTDDRHIVKFMYLEAVAPGFYRNPGVAAWLGRKGVPPEQRFDMMIDVSRARLRERKENR